MNIQDKKESAKKHFLSKGNDADKVYQVTDDGQCFASMHDASNHAMRLGNRDIVEITREEACGDSKVSE